MNPSQRNTARPQAFTLVEVMISTAVGAMILVAVALGIVSFQKVLTATQEYYKATADQMRVLDWISLDMRRAVSGSVSNSTRTLTLNLVDYIDYSQNPPTPRTPAISLSGSGAKVTYGSSGSPTVVYTVAGSSPNQTITRTYTPTSGSATTTILTAALADYQLSCFDPGNAGSTADFSFGGAGQPSSITAKITFMPRFNRLNLAGARTGTAASVTLLLRNHK